MTILGVDNTFNLGSETIAFLKSFARKHDICCKHIIASSYKERYKQRCKNDQSIREIIEASKCNKGIYIIEFTQREVKYIKGIVFDGILFFNEFLGGERFFRHRICNVKKHLEVTNSCKLFILPDTTYFRLNEDISYGWQKIAHISLTSSEEDLEGKLSIQCILQHPITQSAEEFTIPREFGVSGKVRYPEQLLAAVGVLILYGFDVNNMAI